MGGPPAGSQHVEGLPDPGALIRGQVPGHPVPLRLGGKAPLEADPQVAERGARVRFA